MKLSGLRLYRYLQTAGKSSFLETSSAVVDKKNVMEVIPQLPLGIDNFVVKDKKKLNHFKYVQSSLSENIANGEIKEGDLSDVAMFTYRQNKVEKDKNIELSKFITPQGFNILNLKHLSSKVEVKDKTQLEHMKLCTSVLAYSPDSLYNGYALPKIMKNLKIYNKTGVKESISYFNELAAAFKRIPEDGPYFFSACDISITTPNRIKNKAKYSSQYYANVGYSKKEKSDLPDLGYMLEGGIKDPLLNEVTQKSLSMYKKDTFRDTDESVRNYEKLHSLIDVSHAVENKSVSINSPVIRLIKTKLSDRVESYGAKENMHKIAGYYKNGNNTQGERYDTPISLLMKNALETEPLREFSKKYAKEEPKLVKHLYTTYYLPTLSEPVKKECTDIMNNFGTVVYLEDTKDPTAAKLIHKELKTWKKHLKEEFVSPKVINANRYDKFFATQISGYARGSDDVTLLTDSASSIIYVLRHEITHINDPILQKYRYSEPESIVALFADLQANRPYEKDMIKGGINISQRDYANTERSEYIAVSSEGDYAEYSNGYKQNLVNLGLKKEILDMPPLAKQYPKEKRKFVGPNLGYIEYYGQGTKFIAKNVHSETKKASSGINEYWSSKFNNKDFSTTGYLIPTNSLLKNYYYALDYVSQMSRWSSSELSKQLYSRDAKRVQKIFSESSAEEKTISHNNSSIKQAMGPSIAQVVKINKPTKSKIDEVSNGIVDSIKSGEYKLVGISNPTKENNPTVRFSNSHIKQILEANKENGNAIHMDSETAIPVIRVKDKNGLYCDLMFEEKQ